MKCVLHFLILVHKFPVVNEDFYPSLEQAGEKGEEENPLWLFLLGKCAVKKLPLEHAEVLMSCKNNNFL